MLTCVCVCGLTLRPNVPIGIGESPDKQESFKLRIPYSVCPNLWGPGVWRDRRPGDCQREERGRERKRATHPLPDIDHTQGHWEETKGRVWKPHVKYIRDLRCIYLYDKKLRSLLPSAKVNNNQERERDGKRGMKKMDREEWWWLWTEMKNR